MTQAVSVSPQIVDLLVAVADRMLFQHGEATVRPAIDPRTPQAAQDAAVAARQAANATPLGDERLNVAMREAALALAYGRATRRRLQGRLTRIAAERSRMMSRVQSLKQFMAEGVSNE